MSIHVTTSHKSVISISITFSRLIVVSASNKITLIVNAISAIMTTTLIMMCCVIAYCCCCYYSLLCTILRYLCVSYFSIYYCCCH